MPTPLPDFNNTELAFRAKENLDLQQALWLFRLIDAPILGDIGPKIMGKAFEWGLPIQTLVKHTLFKQFVGGTSIKDTIPTSEKMYKFGVKTILDYSVEGEKTEAGFDATCQEIIDTLIHGGKTESVAFTACKITGLGNFDLLAKKQANVQLSPAEEIAWGKIKNRLNLICLAAQANDTPIFIDAEESWIQDTLDDLAEEMMEIYNKTKPLVYTTLQMYRWDRLDYLQKLFQRSQQKNYFLGLKIVRGAYMEKESNRAAEMGYQNPIQPNKIATDNDYNKAILFCIENLDKIAICAGTHNQESCEKLTLLMRDAGIPPQHPHVLFAQLYGMSDNLTYNLAHGGYGAAKYLPYGPVKAVMPYLMRRAQENTSVKGQSNRELDLLGKEMTRRKRGR